MERSVKQVILQNPFDTQTHWKLNFSRYFAQEAAGLLGFYHRLLIALSLVKTVSSRPSQSQYKGERNLLMSSAVVDVTSIKVFLSPKQAHISFLKNCWAKPWVSCQSPDVQKQRKNRSLCFSFSLEQSVPDVPRLCSNVLYPTSFRNSVKHSLDCHGQQPTFLFFGASAKKLEQNRPLEAGVGSKAEQ